MNLSYDKYLDRLVPAIVQDERTGAVLMLGFMNEESLRITEESGKVTFYSRSRQQLWTKGETSGNFLEVVSIAADCDSDTLLIRARPAGPVCHTGASTCFGESMSRPLTSDLIHELETIIDDRYRNRNEESYISKLFGAGINKIAQKVGEEAVELVIEAKDNDRERFMSEAADLLFHYLILLKAKNASFADVLDVLRNRRK
jgi:phosphoribosyl-ATP pyrophosphohydrolase/phosphoribosyl-AMP cyclohydrolase